LASATTSLILFDNPLDKGAYNHQEGVSKPTSLIPVYQP
jgi:hypothetical protein